MRAEDVRAGWGRATTYSRAQSSLKAAAGSLPGGVAKANESARQFRDLGEVAHEEGDYRGAEACHRTADDYEAAAELLEAAERPEDLCCYCRGKGSVYRMVPTGTGSTSEPVPCSHCRELRS